MARLRFIWLEFCWHHALKVCDWYVLDISLNAVMHIRFFVIFWYFSTSYQLYGMEGGIIIQRLLLCMCVVCVFYSYSFLKSWEEWEVSFLLLLLEFWSGLLPYQYIILLPNAFDKVPSRLRGYQDLGERGGGRFSYRQAELYDWKEALAAYCSCKRVAPLDPKYY